MSHKTQLFFINRFYFPDESATSAMLTSLIEGLKLASCDVRVVTGRSYYTADLGELAPREIIDGIHIRRLPSLRVLNGAMLERIVNYMLFHLLTALFIMKHVKRGDVVVCLTDPPLLNVSLALPIRLKGGQLVNWVQDIFPEVATALGFAGPLGKLGSILAPLRNLVWRRSAMNVVIGERMRSLLLAKGVDSSRISVIPNWSDDSNLRPQTDRAVSVRKDWGLSEDDFIIMYSGNLGRAHDITTITAAMKKLESSGYRQVKFVFVGGGAQALTLKSSIEAEGITCAHFFGYRPKSELAQSLSAADVHWISLQPQLEGLIVPSKFYGICAVGKPSIFVGAPDGELAAAIHNRKCGWHVHQGEGAGFAELIERLLASPQEVEDAGNRARQGLEEAFSRSARIAQWQRLLETLTERDQTSRM